MEQCKLDNDLTECYAYCDCIYSNFDPSFDNRGYSTISDCKNSCDLKYSSLASAKLGPTTGQLIGGLVGGISGAIIVTFILICLCRACERTNTIKPDAYYHSIIMHPIPNYITSKQNLKIQKSDPQKLMPEI